MGTVLHQATKGFSAFHYPGRLRATFFGSAFLNLGPDALLQGSVGGSLHVLVRLVDESIIVAR